jgi:aminoglycoside phosphotransferase family enzyme/predicted kinase
MTPDEAALHAWLALGADRVIETACAHVFLGQETAFKMKRHVDLGYADFSTAEKRHWALDRELAFNRTAAPDIYRAIRRVTREAGGGFAFDGAGETADFVLEMRRFDETRVLSACPDVVTGDMAEALGRAIAGYHAVAPLRPETGGRSMAFTVGSNARLLREMAGRLGEDRVERMISLTQAEFERHEPLLARRAQRGFARRCHGDLHLGNILLENGQPVLFDCIEFNDLISDIDIQYDLAFILMDLRFRGRDEAAVRVLSAWLDEAGRTWGDDLWAGMAAMPLMLSVRAGVRAHVCAHSGDDELAKAYVEAAIAHLSPRPAELVAVGGLSGTGKSRFSRSVAAAVGPSPGAVILRTDEVRKRLMKLAPTDRLPPGAYQGELYGRTYDVLLDNARTLLRAGRGVIVDATFMDAPLRAKAEALAAECGVPFEGVWLEAPAQVLRARVAGRTGDASDATVATLEAQLARATDPVGWTRLDTSGEKDVAAQVWLGRR